MSHKTDITIEKDYLILCEGVDAKMFLINYLNCSELKIHPGFADEIQVMDFGGIDQLSSYLEILKKMANFNRVKNILIVRDAETNAVAAINSIRSSLAKNNLSVPPASNMWESGTPNVSYTLFPAFDSQTSGTLEDLCLSIICEPGWEYLNNDIDRFIANLKEQRERKFPHEFKSKLHTYFSITDSFVSMKIGEAAKAGAFDWANEKINPLHDLIAEKL